MSGPRLVRAFLWLHWRQLANALKGRRRSAAARAGAWVQVAAQALVAAALLAVAAALGIGAAFAGLGLAAGGDRAAIAVLLLRMVMGTCAALAVALAALRAGHAGTEGLERLLLLPLSRAALHRLASAPFLADPWLLALVPGLLILALALGRSGLAAAAVALAAGLLFVLAVGSASSAAAHAVRLLFRNRRRAEAVTAIALLAVALFGIAPGVVLSGREPKASAPPAEAPGALAAAAEPARIAWAGRFPWLLQAVPSEAYARAVARAADGAPAAALPSLAALGLVLGGAWALSRRVWERLAGSPATAGRRGRVPLPAWRRRGRLDPGPLAVAGAFARGSLRTVQGKVTVVVPALAGAALAVIGEAQDGPLGPWVAHGPALLAVVAFLSLTTGQNVLLNQFGVDRSGLALELLLPLTARQLLLGRALGCALLTAASFLPALAAVVLAGGGRSPLWLAAVVLGLAGAYAVFFLVAAWLSLLFPKPANLAKLSQEGKPRPAAVLLGFLGLLVTLALPAGAGFAGQLAGGAVGALAAEALFAAGALALFPPLLARTAAALELRREAIYLAMREG